MRPVLLCLLEVPAGLNLRCSQGSPIHQARLFGFLLFSNFLTSASGDHSPNKLLVFRSLSGRNLTCQNVWASGLISERKLRLTLQKEHACTLLASCALGPCLGGKPIYLPAHWLQGSLKAQVSGSQRSFQGGGSNTGQFKRTVKGFFWGGGGGGVFSSYSISPTWHQIVFRSVGHFSSRVKGFFFGGGRASYVLKLLHFPNMETGCVQICWENPCQHRKY